MPNPGGGWDVRASETARSSGHADTKAEALARAREILANAGGGEMVIHGRDGRIQDSTTIGAAASAKPTADGVLVDGVFIRGLSEDDAVTAVRLLRAAREQQFRSGQAAARGLLHTMVEADVELIPPASVEQARRLAGLRTALLTTAVFTHETLREVRGDAKVSTTRTWVSRARERRKLFTVKLDGRSIIPAFQLTETGATRPEYAEILAHLLGAELDGWTIWMWLTSPTPLLSGGVPERLVVDAPERVRRAAQRFAATRRSAA